VSDLNAARQQLLDRLVEIARQIEAHRTAIWKLKQERLILREQIVRSGWQPPAVSA
jgi:hypothetical protein